MDNKNLVNKRKKENKEKYVEKPEFSIILQSFNHKGNIKQIVKNLKLIKNSELIVCEDGSTDGSLEEWLKYKDDPNISIIITNDLHEIRTYNKAAELAKGEILCFIQDDDIPPDSDKWMLDAEHLYKKYPEMGILGGSLGWIFSKKRNKRYGYYNGICIEHDFPFVEEERKIPFLFVDAVNVGPFFIKKSVWEKLGKFNLKFSKVGDSGVCFDFDICLKGWLLDIATGLYKIEGLKRCIGGRGTFEYNTNRESNAKENYKKLLDNYESKIDNINKKVDLGNMILKERTNKKDKKDMRYQDLTIAIMTYDSSSTITACLRKLMYPTQNFIPNIIIYDTGSKDGTVEMLQQQIEHGYWGDAKVRLITDDTDGRKVGDKKAYAYTKLSKMIKTKYIFFVHPGVLIPKFSILDLIVEMEKYDSLGMLGIQYAPNVDHVQVGATIMRAKDAQRLVWNGNKDKCPCRNAQAYFIEQGKIIKHDFRYMAQNYKNLV